MKSIFQTFMFAAATALIVGAHVYAAENDLEQIPLGSRLDCNELLDIGLLHDFSPTTREILGSEDIALLNARMTDSDFLNTLTEKEVEGLEAKYKPFGVEGYRIHNLGMTENQSSYDLVAMEAPREFKPHIHDYANGYFKIVEGTGFIILDGVKTAYKKGDEFIVKAGVSHGFETTTKTYFVSINNPPIDNPVTGKLDFHF